MFVLQLVTIINIIFTNFHPDYVTVHFIWSMFLFLSSMLPSGVTRDVTDRNNIIPILVTTYLPKDTSWIFFALHRFSLNFEAFASKLKKNPEETYYKYSVCKYIFSSKIVLSLFKKNSKKKN